MERDRAKHNKILKGFGAIGASALFAACGTGASVTPTSHETQRPFSTPTTRPSSAETQTPLDTPPITATPEVITAAEIFQEPQIEDPFIGAKQKVLQIWANTWSQDTTLSFNRGDLRDKNPNNFDTTIYIKSSAVNLEEWYTAERNNLLFDGETQTPLAIRLDYTFESMNDNKATASRWIMEMEFNNVEVSSRGTGNLSDADKANKITWDGKGGIKYIWRFRAVEFFNENDYMTDNWKNRDKVEKWIQGRPDFQFTDFGEWKPGYANEYIFDAFLKIIDGQWVVEESPWTRVVDPVYPEYNYTIPLPITDRVDELCRYASVMPELPCKKIEIDLSK